MMSRHSRRLVRAAAVLLVLSVGACSEMKLASHAVKSIGRDGDGGQVGAYKIGSPYQVAGVWYYPKEDLKYRETGIASWYGPGFHGKQTANGERFDQNDLTAAHRTLPLPSMVRVTNLENGRSLVVRVNDRGPFSNGRIIDLSRRSAQLLGFESRGTAKVRVDILEQESRQLAAAARRGETGGETGGESGNAPPAVPAVEVASQALAPPSGAKASGLATPGAVQTASRGAVAAAVAPPVPRPDGRVTREPVRPSSIFIQAGAFLARDNAARLSRQLSGLARSAVTRARVGGQEFYRVRLGPIASVESADRLLATLIDQGHGDARVIVD